MKQHASVLQDKQPETFEVSEPAQQLESGYCGWYKRNLGVYVIVDRYANFIGSIAGIVLSAVLLAVWLVIGSIMGYGNANWWLIIGTYTGLVSITQLYIVDVLLLPHTAVTLCKIVA